MQGKMKVAIVVTLLSFCATFALPVPIDKSDQSRVERTISAEELESELEEIENHVDAVRKKIKEESTENKGSTTGIFSTPSTEMTAAINVKSDKNTTEPQENEITTPSLKPTTQAITKIFPTSTESNNTVVKIQVEKLQPEVVVKEKRGEEKSKNEIKVEKLVPRKKIEVEIVPPAQSKGGEENTEDIVSVEKIPPAGKETKQNAEEESIEVKMQMTKTSAGAAVVEKVEEMSVEEVQTEQQDLNSGAHKEEEEGKSIESVVVEEVVKKKNEDEEKFPAHVSVEKTANDEELDLAAEGIGKNESFISVQKISPDNKQTSAKNKDMSKDSVVVEKINEEENKKETKLPIQFSVERTDKYEDLNLAVGDSRKGDNNDTVISVEEISPTEKNTEVPDSTVSVKVKKVVNEEKVHGPNQITVREVENDEVKEQGKGTEESEEEDLETGGVAGKENAKSEKVKNAEIKEETGKTKTVPDQMTVVKASNDEAEEKSVNLERREMLNNEKEKEDKSVVKETEENVKVAVKKVELVQPSINTGSSQNQDEQEVEEDLQMKAQRPQMEVSPAKEAPLAESDKADYVKVGKVQSATVSNEGVDDADGSRAEEKELDGEQEELTEKETPEERNIAQAFDKALEKERNKVVKMKTEAPATHSPVPTTKIQSPETKETESENQRVKLASKAKSKVDMSIEELELAALADKTLNENDKKGQQVLVSTKTPPTTVVKKKKHPEATVTLMKETNRYLLLSEKETTKEEKKLKEELAKEMAQEKTGPPPLIEIVKTAEKAKIEPTTGTVQEGPDINPNKDFPETKKEARSEQDIEEEREQQLEN